MSEIRHPDEIKHLESAEPGNFLLAARILNDTNVQYTNLLTTIAGGGRMRSRGIMRQMMTRYPESFDKYQKYYDRLTELEDALKSETQAVGITSEDSKQYLLITSKLLHDDSKITNEEYHALAMLIKKAKLIFDKLRKLKYSEKEVIQ